MKDNTMSTFHLRLPKELHNRFKAACALKGKGMRERMIELIINSLKEKKG